MGCAPSFKNRLGHRKWKMAGIQIRVLDRESSHIYGKLTANQRIEALWSVLRPSVIDDWKVFFNTLFHEGVVKEGDDEQIAILQFCFMGLVQNSVDVPGGVPDILFYSTESSLTPADEDVLAEAVNFCSVPSLTGSQFYDNALNDLMEFHHLQKPGNKDDAVMLFSRLLHLLNE